MADNRSKAKIKEDHDKHVDEERYSAWTLYTELPVIDPDRGYLGSTAIQVCCFCPHMEVTCNHDTNDWIKDGTVLKCRLCGMDVT